MKWLNPVIAAALAVPLGGALYIDFSSLTLGQALVWALFGMVASVADLPVFLRNDALLRAELQAFAFVLSAIALLTLFKKFRKKAQQSP